MQGPLPIVFASGLLAWAGFASASTTSANFQVNLDVLPGSCTLDAGSNTPFSYDPQEPTDLNYALPLATIQCSSAVGWTLSADQGQHPETGSSCNNPLRRMAQGASVLVYGLFLDVPHAQPFGCDASVVVGTGSANVQGYLSIPPGQFPTATGLHSDTVVMTLSF